jgi:hypothetical protein
MAWDSLDKVVVGLRSGQILPYYKSAGPATTGAGLFFSLWQSAGTPGQGSVPSNTATFCTDSMAGAYPISFSTSMASGAVCCFQPCGANISQWHLYDRLIAVASLTNSTTVTIPCAVTLSLPHSYDRCTSTGSDVEWFVEIYTDVGITAAVAVFQYKGSDNNLYSISVTVSGASPNNQDGRLIQIPLTVPNVYIKEMIEVRQTTSTAVAGNYGVTAMKRLAMVGQSIANVTQAGDWASIGLPTIIGNSCLQLVALASTTAIGSTVYAHIKVAETPA